ncbi:MAG: helix-turn-helix transcriptional regulator [Candidatus Lokiarchaeota archaeon]|nr:helix-turn-helix transcriptional regulator [Candidatus Lokiarchaeota archaeon]
MVHLRYREIRSGGEPVGQYGYEMIKDLDKLFAGSWEAKSGTIYPILSKLETNKKLLTGERKKSPLGPVKKVYSLTENGRIVIDEILSHNLEMDVEFIQRYLELMSIFVASGHFGDEEIMQKFLDFANRSITIAMEKVVTDYDREYQEKKLKVLKKGLNRVLTQLEGAIDQLSKE